MPFYISYRLGSGPGTLFAESASEALLLYHELRTQKARPIKIRDETGVVVRPEQLSFSALSADTNLNRIGGAGD